MQDDIFIIKNYGKLTNKKICETLGIKNREFHRRRYNLAKKYLDGKKELSEKDRKKGIAKLKQYHKDKEIKEKQAKFIIENHDKMSISEMAKNLGISYNTAYGRTQALIREGLIDTSDMKVDKQNYIEKKARPKPIKDLTWILDNRRKMDNEIAELDANIKLGKRYRVRKINPGKNCTSELTGELIQITNDFYVIKGKYTESFLKKDFIIGEYSIEEV